MSPLCSTPTLVCFTTDLGALLKLRFVMVNETVVVFDLSILVTSASWGWSRSDGVDWHLANRFSVSSIRYIVFLFMLHAPRYSMSFVADARCENQAWRSETWWKGSTVQFHLFMESLPTFSSTVRIWTFRIFQQGHWVFARTEVAWYCKFWIIVRTKASNGGSWNYAQSIVQCLLYTMYLGRVRRGTLNLVTQGRNQTLGCQLFTQVH